MTRDPYDEDLEQLLNAHGILAVGPRHTLPNLRRLFSARQHKCMPAPATTAHGGGGKVIEVVEAGQSVVHPDTTRFSTPSYCALPNVSLVGIEAL